MAFLMRVELPDVPGSLGAMATALGSAGADIEAIEIVEHRSDGRAVDDVLLDLPEGVMPDMVVSACRRLDGVDVLWISRYTAGANLHLDLEAVESLTERPGAAVSRLVELVPVVFRSDWSVLVQPGPDRDPTVSVAESTSAAPDVSAIGASWLPLRRGRRLEAPADTPGWESTLLIGVPLGSAEQVLVAGRRGGPDYLDSELARMAHLAALAASIAAAASDGEDPADPVDPAEPGEAGGT